ncbi:hypothetical protein FGRA07_11404 [Fusarium graminearum]|nr:hypothetical protein FGRA07_11404 [Fusarium graminearum]
MDQKPTNHHFKCNWPECNKTLKSKQSFIRHCRLHTGDRPHACSLCPERFSRKYELIDHICSHTGKWPLQCQDCGQGFSQSWRLASHKQKHKNKNHTKRKGNLKQSDTSPSASKQDENFPSTIQYSSTVLLSNDTVQKADRNGKAHCATPCTDTQQQNPNGHILQYFGLEHETSADRPPESGEHTVNQRHTETQFVDQRGAGQYQNNAAHGWNPYVTGTSALDVVSPSTHHQSFMISLPGDIIFTSQVAAANGPFHFTPSYADTDSQTHDHGARIPDDFHLAHDTPIAMPPSHHYEHTISEQRIDAQPVYEAVAMPYQVGYAAEDRNHDISMVPRSVPTDNGVPQVALPSSEVSYFSPVTPASIQSSPGSSSATWVPIQTPQGVFDPYQMGTQPTDAAVESQPALLQHQQPIQQYTAKSLLPVVSQTQHMPTASEDCDTLETMKHMLVTNLGAPIQYSTDGEMSAYEDGLLYGSTAIPNIDLSILDGGMVGDRMDCFADVLR